MKVAKRLLFKGILEHGSVEVSLLSRLKEKVALDGPREAISSGFQREFWFSPVTFSLNLLP
jgi:hypothetical protein